MRSVWIAIAVFLPFQAAALPASSQLAAEPGKVQTVQLLADNDIVSKSKALYDSGVAYLRAEDYATALSVLEEGLSLVAANSDENRGVASNLSGSPNANAVLNFSSALGETHQWLGHLGSALNYYRQALSGDPIEPVRAVLLVNIGTIEAAIGQYDQAELTLQQAVDLNRRLEKPREEASALLALGWIDEQQIDYDRAIAYYDQASGLYRQIGSISEEADTLNNLGIVHLKQGDLSAAKKALDRGWSLLEAEEDLYSRSLLLDSYGRLSQQEGKRDLAWSQYLQGLQLSAQTGDTIGEIESSLNLAALMEDSFEPALAIFFYKRAIAKIEIIRSDLQSLPLTAQQSYTATVESAYRQLADLLLSQNRTAEALQVLELLKLQEVDTYLRGQTQESRPISLSTSAEANLESVLESFLESTSLIELSAFLELPETRAVSSQIGSTTDSFDLQVIESLQAALSAQPVKTAVLYPLVLPDRLELILITSEGLPIHRQVQVTQSHLTRVVGELQSQLHADSLDPTALSQQLYQWLVHPLDEILEEQDIENIVYLPDSILRYIPLAALHDGQQWLAQKYQSHNITAASIDNLTRTGSPDLTVVAGALTENSPPYSIRVGQQQFSYTGLSGAKQEVERLVATLPDTMALFDQAFTSETILEAASDHRVVHLATHAKFLPGQPEDSFVLFGDGNIVTLRELGEWQLSDVDLVVFSACQTATSVDAEGKEILGLGFQMQQAGAGSAIAALWAVDDNSTAALMGEFYAALQSGKSKAQALQQAQTQLIKSRRFSHPNAWAAFILIGNGR
ncbi:MAG: CHAT domain-containing protein [Phormidesmis sp.]